MLKAIGVALLVASPVAAQAATSGDYLRAVAQADAAKGLTPTERTHVTRCKSLSDQIYVAEVAKNYSNPYLADMNAHGAFLTCLRSLYSQ